MIQRPASGGSSGGSPEPRLHRRPGDGSAATPHAAWRDLDERDVRRSPRTPSLPGRRPASVRRAVGRGLRDSAPRPRGPRDRMRPAPRCRSRRAAGRTGSRRSHASAPAASRNAARTRRARSRDGSSSASARSGRHGDPRSRRRARPGRNRRAATRARHTATAAPAPACRRGARSRRWRSSDRVRAGAGGRAVRGSGRAVRASANASGWAAPGRSACTTPLRDAEARACRRRRAGCPSRSSAGTGGGSWSWSGATVYEMRRLTAFDLRSGSVR